MNLNRTARHNIDRLRDDETPSDVVLRIIEEAGYDVMEPSLEEKINRNTEYFNLFSKLPSDREWRTTQEIIDMIGEETTWTSMTSGTLGTLRTKGLVESRPLGGRKNEWRLTDTGMEVHPDARDHDG